MASKRTVSTMGEKVSSTQEDMVALEKEINELTIFLRNKEINDNQTDDAIEGLKKANDTLETLGMAYREVTSWMLQKISLPFADDNNFSSTVVQEIVDNLIQLGVVRSSSSSSNGDNLIKIKDRASKLRIKLSRLLIDFFFLIPDKGRVIEIIGYFKIQLLPLRGKVVSKKLFNFFGMVEEHVRSAYSIGERSSNMEELLINEFIDHCIPNLIKKILELELCMREVLMDSELNLERVEISLNLCEKSINEIEEQIRMRQKPFGNNDFLISLMKLQVFQIWK